MDLNSHTASGASAAGSSVPEGCAEGPLRKDIGAGPLTVRMLPQAVMHPLALPLPWRAHQATCTRDHPDGRLEAASYYFIITARIMTGPERLIAAGEVSGQGTEKENKDEEWHAWL